MKLILVPAEATEVMCAVSDRKHPPFGTPESLARPGFRERWIECGRRNYADIYSSMLEVAPQADMQALAIEVLRAYEASRRKEMFSEKLRMFPDDVSHMIKALSEALK